MGSGVKSVRLFTSQGCWGGADPNSQIEFEGQGRPYGNGNMSFFTTRLFHQRIIGNLRDTAALTQPEFVFVLMRLEILQPMVNCL